MNDSSAEGNPRPRCAPAVGLSFLLSQAGTHAAQAFTARLDAIDLKPVHVGVLRLLVADPGPTQRELHDRLGVLASQLVAYLDTLEARGLVERRRNPHDRRSNLLFATAAGHHAMRDVERITAELEADLFAALTDDERSTLLATLRKVVAAQDLEPGVHPAYRNPSN